MIDYSYFATDEGSDLEEDDYPYGGEDRHLDAYYEGRHEPMSFYERYGDDPYYDDSPEPDEYDDEERPEPCPSYYEE